VARHTVIYIRSNEELRNAIKQVIAYSPVFIVERFIKNSFTHRATVVDFNYVAVVKQVAANVVGNGILSIQELVKKKNYIQHRSNLRKKERVLCSIVIDNTTMELLAQKNYDLQTIPKKDEIVYLQKKPFLKLGCDLVEVTKKVHVDNIRLFKDIAQFFDIRLVGIDFMIPDITRPWKDQPCAILELNSVPSIELHHFPSSGVAQNVAGAVVDLFFKYYI